MSKSCSCGKVPVIMIPGIGQAKTAEIGQDGTPKRVVWPLDSFDGKKVIADIIPSALKSVLFRKDCDLSQSVYNALFDQLDLMRNNPDGTPAHIIKPVSYPNSLKECTPDERRFIYRMMPLPEIEEDLGSDHVFYFSYFSFGQSVEIADALHDFILSVCEKTGHSKVNLVAVSLGGVVTCNYLGKYGHSLINRVIGIVPAYDGSMVIADLLNRYIDFEGFEFAIDVVFGGDAACMVNKYLAVFSPKTRQALMHAVIDALVDCVFINSQMMWSAIPYEMYPEMRDKLLTGSRYAAMRAVTDETYGYKKAFAENVKKAQADGVIFQTVCCYGHQLLEFCGSNTVDSDHIVHTHSTSMGAEIAPLGQTLSQGEMLSPCSRIDASKGLAPDTTWYFANCTHERVDKTKEILSLVRWLLADESYKDVNTNELYPQFNEIRS